MIAIEERQYNTYILSDPYSILELIPERGGIVTRWQVQGQDIFYLDTERLLHPELSIRGGNPILFPICGNLPDNSYTYKEQPYTLKQHGFARDLPWDVADQWAEDDLSLTLLLKSSDNTRAVYPFDFQLEFTYSLQGDMLATHQRFTNHSAEPMPFSVGFHPYFCVSDKTQLEFTIPATEFQDKSTTEKCPFKGEFDFQQDEIDIAFQQLSGHTAQIIDRSRNLRLTLDYSHAFSTLVFWTLKGKEFYCLEPWTAPRNALNTGDHLLYIDPGESLETVFNLAVDFL
jgi:galactose mutarotase-like enzyme